MTTFYSRNLFKMLGMLALFLLPFSTYATTFTAVTSGDWDSVVTWGGIAPDETIDEDDQIIIGSGITVHLNVDVTLDNSLASLAINGELSGQSNLTINSGTVTSVGQLVVNQLVISKDALVLTLGDITAEIFKTTASSLMISNNLTVNSSLILTAGNLQIDNSATLNIANDATISLEGGQLNLLGNATLKSEGRYNLEYRGGSQNTNDETHSLEDVNNVIVQLDSDAILTLSTSLVFYGTLQLEQGNINLNGRSITIAGNIATSGNGSISTTGTTGEIIEFSDGSTGGSLRFSNDSNLIGRLRIDSPTAEVTLHNNIEVAILSIIDGRLILNGQTIILTERMDSSARGSIVGDAAARLVCNTSSNNFSKIHFTTDAEILHSLVIKDHITLTSKLTVENLLEIESGHLSIGNTELVLNGTIKVDTNNEFTGINLIFDTDFPLTELVVNGSGNLIFSGDKRLAVLTMNSTEGDLQIASDLLINAALNLNNGNIILVEGNLKIAADATITGGSESSYVQTDGEGELILTLTADGETYEFPIGTQDHYCPAIIAQAEGSTTTDIKVRADANVLMEGEVGAIVNDDVVANTWFVSQTDASAEVDLSLQFFWNAQAEASSFDRNNCFISHYENSEWDASAAVEANVEAQGYFSVERTGITSLSPFRVEDATPTSVFNSLEVIEYKLFPNPAADVILLEMPILAQAKTAKVFSADGKLLLQQEVRSGHTNSLNIADLTAGETYFLQVGSAKAKAFVKQ